MKYKIILLVLLFIALAFLLTGCVPGGEQYTVDSPAGFWWGLWHGLIVIITFFMGLFTGGEYTIYEVLNTGWPYNLGFLIGISVIFGGSSGGLVRINIGKN